MEVRRIQIAKNKGFGARRERVVGIQDAAAGGSMKGAKVIPVELLGDGYLSHRDDDGNSEENNAEIMLDGHARLSGQPSRRSQIHPNAAGARRIADTVWEYLEPLVR